jgi:hypothetical protein
MRRSGLLIASLFLACGASLALAAPAQAAVRDSGHHPHSWYCDDDDQWFNGNDYDHHGHRHHHHYHYNSHGIFVGIGIGIGL